jgi:hypothetical protein
MITQRRKKKTKANFNNYYLNSKKNRQITNKYFVNFMDFYMNIKMPNNLFRPLLTYIKNTRRILHFETDERRQKKYATKCIIHKVQRKEWRKREKNNVRKKRERKTHATICR